MVLAGSVSEDEGRRRARRLNVSRSDERTSETCQRWHYTLGETVCGKSERTLVPYVALKMCAAAHGKSQPLSGSWRGGAEANPVVRLPLALAYVTLSLSHELDLDDLSTPRTWMIQASPRVLVVDDDPPICDLIELALVDDGWEVQTRTRVQEALQLLLTWSADLIVLDLKMPDMDAEGFLAAYREKTQRPAPILLTSAASDIDHHAERLGVSGVLAKPFDVDELCTRVRRLLEPGRALTVGNRGPNGC
jgi:CheY-like chemotaxis protein